MVEWRVERFQKKKMNNKRPIKNIAARSSSLSPLAPPINQNVKSNSSKPFKESVSVSSSNDNPQKDNLDVSKLKQEILLKNKIIYDLNKSQLWLKSKLPSDSVVENDEKTRLFGLLERFNTDLEQAKEACERVLYYIEFK